MSISLRDDILNAVKESIGGKTGCEPPKFRPPARVAKTNPPNVGSSVQRPKQHCTYETPCGWCTKWDKKCDKKVGCVDDKPKRGLRAKAGIFYEDYMGSELDDIRSGKGLSRISTVLDPNKPLPSGIRKDF